jgi:hypothetical protein
MMVVARIGTLAIPELDKLGWWYFARDTVTQHRTACSSVAGFGRCVSVFKDVSIVEVYLRHVALELRPTTGRRESLASGEPRVNA